MHEPNKGNMEEEFYDSYHKHALCTYFSKRNVTEADIHLMFHSIEAKIRKVIKLEKKCDSGKFVVPCTVAGYKYSNALCDTGSAVSIMHVSKAFQLGLDIEPCSDMFTLVDCSRVNA